MRIKNLSTTLIEIPMERPIGDATATWSSGGGCFVELETDSGVKGLGFSAVSSAVREVIERTLKRVVLDRDPLDTEGIWRDMFWAVRGTGRKGVAFCAISAVDIALWDLKARALGLPLFKLLGACRDRVPVYGSGGWTTLSERELLTEMASYIERGIPRIKMKVGKGFGTCEAEDLHRLAAVRREVGDDVVIYLDANNGYYAKQAVRMARRFEDYGVAWFEEPVLADDIEGLAAVSRASTIPVATGEHEYTKYGFKDLIARGGADIVQPDVGRVGGVTEWIKVAHLAESYNLPVAPHAAQLVHLHLACATPNLHSVEVLGITEQQCHVMFKEVPEPVDGTWAPFPDRPGLGLELNPEAVLKYGR